MRRLLILLLAVGACHGKRADENYFGKQVSPPGILAQIRPGMTLAQVKAIAPEAKEDPNKGLWLAKPASNITFYATMHGDVVHDTYIDYGGGDGIQVLTAAWGPPDKEPDRGPLHNTTWRSTATGWRASAVCSNGSAKSAPFCTIDFHPHLPIENMFGKAIAPPGELAKLTPRMTLAQVKATTQLAELTDKPTQTVDRWLAYDGAVEQLAVVDGRLFSIVYSVPVSARPAIEKAWGPARTEAGHEIWFDPNTGWSATLADMKTEPSEMELAFEGYQPFLAEVALLEKLTAAPTAADAKRSHPELEWDPTVKNDDQPSLLLANNEFADPGYRLGRILPVAFFGNSVAVRAVMGMLDPEREAAIVDALTTKWGAPKKTTQSNGDVEYRFAKHGALIREGTSLALHVGPDA